MSFLYKILDKIVFIYFKSLGFYLKQKNEVNNPYIINDFKSGTNLLFLMHLEKEFILNADLKKKVKTRGFLKSLIFMLFFLIFFLFQLYLYFFFSYYFVYVVVDFFIHQYNITFIITKYSCLLVDYLIDLFKNYFNLSVSFKLPDINFKIFDNFLNYIFVFLNGFFQKTFLNVDSYEVYFSTYSPNNPKIYPEFKYLLTLGPGGSFFYEVNTPFSLNLLENFDYSNRKVFRRVGYINKNLYKNSLEINNSLITIRKEIFNLNLNVFKSNWQYPKGVGVGVNFLHSMNLALAPVSYNSLVKSELFFNHFFSNINFRHFILKQKMIDFKFDVFSVLFKNEFGFYCKTNNNLIYFKDRGWLLNDYLVKMCNLGDLNNLKLDSLKRQFVLSVFNKIAFIGTFKESENILNGNDKSGFMYGYLNRVFYLKIFTDLNWLQWLKTKINTTREIEYSNQKNLNVSCFYKYYSGWTKVATNIFSKPIINTFSLKDDLEKEYQVYYVYSNLESLDNNRQKLSSFYYINLNKKKYLNFAWDNFFFLSKFNNKNNINEVENSYITKIFMSKVVNIYSNILNFESVFDTKLMDSFCKDYGVMKTVTEERSFFLFDKITGSSVYERLKNIKRLLLNAIQKRSFSFSYDFGFYDSIGVKSLHFYLKLGRLKNMLLLELSDSNSFEFENNFDFRMLKFYQRSILYDDVLLMLKE